MSISNRAPRGRGSRSNGFAWITVSNKIGALLCSDSRCTMPIFPAPGNVVFRDYRGKGRDVERKAMKHASWTRDRCRMRDIIATIYENSRWDRFFSTFISAKLIFLTFKRRHNLEVTPRVESNCVLGIHTMVTRETSVFFG